MLKRIGLIGQPCLRPQSYFIEFVSPYGVWIAHLVSLYIANSVDRMYLGN